MKSLSTSAVFLKTCCQGGSIGQHFPGISEILVAICLNKGPDIVKNSYQLPFKHRTNSFLSRVFSDAMKNAIKGKSKNNGKIDRDLN